MERDSTELGFRLIADAAHGCREWNDAEIAASTPARFEIDCRRD
jgi:hypothetical protein